MLSVEMKEKRRPNDDTKGYGDINPGCFRQSRRPQWVKADHVREKRVQGSAACKQDCKQHMRAAHPEKKCKHAKTCHNTD